MADSSRPRRRRRWLLVLAALLVPAAATVWWLARLLEPERLAGFLLERASLATGLSLRATGEAGVGLWPDLHVRLEGVSATAPGAPGALFTAQRLDLVLPWSALLDRQAVVERLRLSTPVLQRDALARWLASRPEPTGPPAPLHLPELTAGLVVEDGAVVGDGDDAWALERITLRTSALLAGTRFSASLAGLLHVDGARHELALSFETTPVQRGDALALDPLSLHLEAPGLVPPLDLEGQLQLTYPTRLALQLAGPLGQWPTAWPSLPEGSLPLAFSVAYDGPADFSVPLALTAHGDAGRLELKASVPELLAWRANLQASPVPPMDARLSSPRLELGGVVVEGIEVRSEPGPVPPTEPR